MRAWTPQTLYDAKPWIFVVLGAVLAVGMMLWSLSAGLWTVWRGLLCFAGAALATMAVDGARRRRPAATFNPTSNVAAL